MAIELQINVSPRLAMLPSPALVQFAETLAESAPDVEREIEREICCNPALVRVDRSSPIPSLDHLANRPTATDQLLEALRLTTRSEDRLIAEYVVGSLNEYGFLTEHPHNIAQHLGVPRERVDQVVDELRAHGPPGTGARDVRECLLLQMDALEQEGTRHTLARAVVSNHLILLARGDYRAIALALTVSEEDVRDAHEFIRHRLRPRPVPQGEREPEMEAIPSIAFIRRPDGGFQVIGCEEERCALRIDPLYRELAHRTDADPQVRAHSLAHVEQATLFVSRLRQRWVTLRRLGEILAVRQPGFLREGRRGALPLTQSSVAREMGVHESTVSRTVAGKYAALPSGEVVAIREFFRPATGIEATLRALILAESRPLSDRELAQKLEALGRPLARRTVAKYRARISIPAAGRR